MEDNTAAVEAVVATVVTECWQLATWVVAQREADLRTLEAGWPMISGGKR